MATEDTAATFFRDVDVDKDGIISREEFGQAFQDGTFVVGSRPMTSESELRQESKPVAKEPMLPKINDVTVEEAPLSPAMQQAVSDVEKRIATVQNEYSKLIQVGEALQKENEELKEVVRKARSNAERRILKKRAENVQLLADNAELERFTLEASRLAETKSKLHPEMEEWEVLRKKKEAMTRRLERLMSKPLKIPLGATMASPRESLSSIEATPRIDAVQQWRSSPITPF